MIDINNQQDYFNFFIFPKMEKTKVEAGAGTAMKAGMFGAFGVTIAGVVITVIVMALLCLCCSLPSIMSGFNQAM